MRTLTTLLALLRGRLTGLHRLTVRGREYVLFARMAGAEDPPAGGDPQPGGEPSGTGEPEPSGEPSGSPEPKKDPEVEKAYAKLREAEKRAEAAEKAKAETAERLKAIEDAEKSELEKAQAKLQEYEDRDGAATEMLRQANLIAELSKPEYKLSSAKAAAKLIEGVEFSETHEPEGVEEAVTALREETPGLFVDHAPAGGSPANGSKGKTKSAEELRKIAREDPKRFSEMLEAGEVPAEALSG